MRICLITTDNDDAAAYAAAGCVPNWNQMQLPLSAGNDFYSTKHTRKILINTFNKKQFDWLIRCR